MKYSLSIVLLYITSLYATAQSWYVADIDTIKQSGYYNIELDKRIIAVSNNANFLDIRINDTIGNEVPYFVRAQSPVRAVNEFISYDLESNTTKDSINTIVVRNENGENLNRFSIAIESAEVDKYITIRGSNDLKQWYIVKKRENITYSGFKEGNNEILIIDFPQGNYKYYELTLTNNQSSPLQILKVGRFKNSNIYAQQTEIDLGTFIRKDSTDKKTYIRFPDLKYNYRLNKLTFYINSKAEYLRKAELNGKDYSIRFNLSSKGENTIVLNSTAISPEGVIVIDNKGNPPLVIDSIKAYALNRYLCAYLEEGQCYTLVIGNKDIAPSSDYDIKYFQDEIPEDLQIVKTSNFEKIEVAAHSNEREKMWIEKPVFLWSIIILVGLFLSAICYKMIREMKKKEEK